MKKDRNCSMGAYPVYPMYSQMGMPGVMPPMQSMPTVPNSMMSYTNTQQVDNDSIINQINSLDKRITRLENIISSNQVSPSYSESNFYMV